MLEISIHKKSGKILTLLSVNYYALYNALTHFTYQRVRLKRLVYEP